MTEAEKTRRVLLYAGRAGDLVKSLRRWTAVPQVTVAGGMHVLPLTTGEIAYLQSVLRYLAATENGGDQHLLNKITALAEDVGVTALSAIRAESEPWLPLCPTGAGRQSSSSDGDPWLTNTVRKAAAVPGLVNALQAYLALDDDVANDSVEPEDELERWAECHALAAEALKRAGVALPAWLAEAIMVQEEQP